MTSPSDTGGSADTLGRSGSDLPTGEHRTARRALRWFSWIFGLSMLAAVIIAALHFSEELGETASPTGVFASFMVSTLLRTISIVPGGLGAFEAASVLTLKVAGVPLAVALVAMLLFRGLSFWLPMVPSLVISRGAGTSNQR